MYYNFDEEVMLAYRCKANMKHKQVSLTIVPPPDFKDDEPLVAHWDDGDVSTIPGMSWGKFRGMQDPSARTAGGSVLWSAVQEGTNHKLTLIQKIDRNLLVVLKEQQKQVLMVRVDHFGSIPDQSKPLPPNSEVLKKAALFMKEISMKFAKGEMKRAELIPYRNKMRSTNALVPKKRPSAADYTEQKQDKTKKCKKNTSTSSSPGSSSAKSTCAEDEESTHMPEMIQMTVEALSFY